MAFDDHPEVRLYRPERAVAQQLDTGPAAEEKPPSPLREAAPAGKGGGQGPAAAKKNRFKKKWSKKGSRPGKGGKGKGQRKGVGGALPPDHPR